ncbi:hypothetical protein ACWEQC_21860 [Streptomyces shenzhenensis]
MTIPSPEELDRSRHELANGLLVLRDQMTPIFDQADGMKADMQRRGWSPTAAEQVALVWLLGAVNMAMSAGRPK